MQLSDAAWKLNDADAAVRDAAQKEILAAKSAAIPHLVNALKKPGAPVARIALFLAALNGVEGVPALVELVERGMLDMDARTVVSRALAELVTSAHAGDSKVRRAVEKLARDGTPQTRTSAVRALGALGDVDSVAVLKSMAFTEQHIDVKTALVIELKSITEREAALRALQPSNGGAGASPPATGGGVPEGGELFDIEAAVRAQQSNPSGAPIFAVEDAPTGPHANIIVRLRDPRWAVRSQAVDDAVAVGKDIVPSLEDVLQGYNSGARIGAAQALARLQAPAAAEGLLAAVLRPATNDDDRTFIPIALKALANSLTGAEEGFAQPLIPLARHDDPFVRAGALLCLGRLSDRVGARVATIALTDPHDHVREAAAVALSEGVREEDGDLVLPLLAVLGGMPSPPLPVREAILLALARIDVTDQPTLVRLRHRVRPSVLGMTSSLRRTSIAVLERSYGAADPPPLGVIDDVVTRLTDDHPEVRLLSASFLAQHLEPGMTGVVEKIEDALDREERPVSLLCLEALRRHDTGKAKLALEAVAADVEHDDALAARAKELLEGWEPKTDEWIAPPKEAAPAESASVSEQVVEEPAPVDRTEPRRSRVRPASAEQPVSDEVVEAKEAGPRLKDQLMNAAQDVRERVLSAFESTIPKPKKRLREALQEVDALPHDERAKKRAAILDTFQ